MGHSPVDGWSAAIPITLRHRGWNDGYRFAPSILLLRPFLLGQQRFADLLEFAAVGLVDLGKMQVESVQRADDGRADHHAGEPFVVGRYDVPWRLLRRGVADHVLIGR